MADTTDFPRAKLTDAFSELFVLGTYVRDARDLGSCEALRTRLVTMFNNADAQGRESGFSQDTLAQARYAVAAFIDEMVFTSNWPSKDQWTSHPLQYEFFGEYVAGEGFFKRLEAIRGGMPLNTDLLEVYVNCLILGFEGQYRVHEREKLRGLIEDTTREIQAKREVLPFSPHGQRPEELLELVKRELPAWVVLVTGLGIVFFFYLGLSLLISHDADLVVQELRQLLVEVNN